MINIFDWPGLIFLISLIVQWLAAYGGQLIRRRRSPLEPGQQADLDTIRNATITLLGIIIGFSFSMAVSRYDQRKGLEEAEANAIGTEYLRAALLSDDATTKVRELLTNYAGLRIAFYEAGRNQSQVDEIQAKTTKIATELWSAILRTRSPTPVTALAISGMNDVLNAQGYTEGAWRNRIPVSAWVLMGLIAIACSMLLGAAARRSDPWALLILPLVLSVAFFLIADIDSPRGGVISVRPQNLITLSRLLDEP